MSQRATDTAPQRGIDARGGMGRYQIDASEWSQQRWGWLEGVRRDAALSPMARLVAHTLALEFAHHRTLRCDPSFRQLAAAVGTSPDTIKRSIQALCDAAWIIRERGLGRGNYTAYGFLTRAKIVQLKGGRIAPVKGGRDAPLSGRCRGPQKGADLHGKGGKSAPPYNIAKPYKNHDARGSAGNLQGKQSNNPMVIQDAERAVTDYRNGRDEALSQVQSWVLDHILAAGLLTETEIQNLGLEGA